MCLILIALDTHPVYSLVVAANRDEFYDRPAAAAAFWPEAPCLLAGRDLKSGGTWLGITRTGRIAAVTNYRDPAHTREGAPSRGKLVSGYLTGTMTPADYLAKLQQAESAYNGFTLIVGSPRELWQLSNRGNRPAAITSGFHGLANHLLDTPWPKVLRGRDQLARLLAPGTPLDPEALFVILADRTPAPDHLLPDTGVGLERERLLSPLFVETPTYGTRSSTILLVDRQGEVTFVERRFNGESILPETATYRFTLSG